MEVLFIDNLLLKLIISCRRFDPPQVDNYSLRKIEADQVVYQVNFQGIKYRSCTVEIPYRHEFFSASRIQAHALK